MTKPSLEVLDIDEEKIKIVCEKSFVSLGGYKLDKALDDFNFSVNDMICLDVGASTGGFTDCLLKRSAKKVYAVDLNDDLLHEKLKLDNRVVPVIKNARELSRKDFVEDIDLLVADLSFISATYVLDVFSELLSKDKKAIILIKPQFETGGKKKYKNGIIRDKKVQLNACHNVYDVAKNYGFSAKAFTTAPISDDKNIEFLMLFEKNGQICLEKNNITF
jgi:23S rRNA (cytidine1920-2'-O)/16S rRNA (cytidine1409-2'-O)-methyltransferase